MTEIKYLKIISDLFRLSGYSLGMLEGVYWQEHENAQYDQALCGAIQHIKEHQNLILMQLDEGE